MRRFPIRPQAVALLVCGLLVLLLLAGAWDWWWHGGYLGVDTVASTGRLSTGEGEASGFFVRDGRGYLGFRDLTPVPLVPGPDACSLGSRETFRVVGRFGRVKGKGEGVAPTCYYLGILPGRGPECLVEFPAGKASHYTTTGASAAMAHNYYRLRQGGIIHIVPAEGRGSTGDGPGFLVMDRRWCDWFGAAEGLRLVGRQEGAEAGNG